MASETRVWRTGILRTCPPKPGPETCKQVEPRHSSHMSVKQVVEQRSNPVERAVKADLCPEFERDRIDMWTNIRFCALHGSFAPALFGTAVPCGNGLSRFAGFPHQAVIQPRIKTRFVVGIGPGGLAKTSPQILETVAHHLGNVPESGKVLVFHANVERSRFATYGGTPDPIDLKAVEQHPFHEVPDRRVFHVENNQPPTVFLIRTDAGRVCKKIVLGIRCRRRGGYGKIIAASQRCEFH